MPAKLVKIRQTQKKTIGCNIQPFRHPVEKILNYYLCMKGKICIFALESLTNICKICEFYKFL